MGKKVLVIGTYSSEDVDSFSWWQELPNLADYDTVILDTTKIANHWFIAGRLEHLVGDEYLISNVNQEDERLKSNLRLIRNKLLEMLEFEVTIYTLYTPKIIIMQELGDEYIPESLRGSRKPRITFISTDEWCPISIEMVAEKGKIIQIENISYEKYFGAFKGWEYFFVSESLQISDLEHYYADRYKVQVSLLPIATNKVMKPIAVEIIPYFHRWAHDIDEPEGGWHSTPQKQGGSLVFLPMIDKYHTESLIEDLLQRGKEFEETQPPSWVDAIEIPGESLLKVQIASEKQELEKIQAKIGEKEASLEELRKYKRLLYTDGPELQDICNLAFESIGARTKPSPVSDEFMIEVNGKEALVEVKGHEKNILKRDIAQLISDMGQLGKTVERPELVKGILIGNAWRNSPLEDRDTNNQPLFTETVVQYAEAQNISLLPTIELFKAYCMVLEQPESRSKILNKIIGGKGIVRF